MQRVLMDLSIGLVVAYFMVANYCGFKQAIGVTDTACAACPEAKAKPPARAPAKFLWAATLEKDDVR